MLPRSGFLRLSVLLFVAACAAVASQEGANADLWPYKLNGSLHGRTYTRNMNPSLSPSWYESAATLAVADWNNTGETSFSLSYDNSSSTVDFYSGSYGAVGWRGIVNLYDIWGSSKSQATNMVVSQSSPPVGNWDYVEIVLNHSYISSDISANTFNKTRNTAGHEFGHAISIAHDSYIQTLMYFSIANYDQYFIYQPQYWDVYWADQAGNR